MMRELIIRAQNKQISSKNAIIMLNNVYMCLPCRPMRSAMCEWQIENECSEIEIKQLNWKVKFQFRSFLQFIQNETTTKKIEELTFKRYALRLK